MYDMISNDAEFMVFNTKEGPFKDKKMRQATAYAIDVENVLEKGYMGDGVLTDNIYYPGFMGVSDTLNNYQTDLDKSIELMACLLYTS